MAEEMDPVCGMKVDPEKAKWKTFYKGKKYYFCSNHCLERFLENPDEYLLHGPKGM